MFGVAVAQEGKTGQPLIGKSVCKSSFLDLSINIDLNLNGNRVTDCQNETVGWMDFFFLAPHGSKFQKSIRKCYK